MSDEVPAVIRALYSGLESGAHGEALRGLFTAGASSVEHPNAFNPAGSRRSLDEMLAASTAGAGLLREQSYDVRSCIVAGDLAILRVRWTGIVARDVGPLRTGRSLVADIAQFVQIDGQRIAAIETYDCYEPLDHQRPA